MKKRNPAIYKYTKVEYVEACIKNGIYCSEIHSLNDPYEYFHIEQKEKFYVCSLTKSLNAKLMWSHYADSHKGCIVQIELPKNYNADKFVLKEVNYSSKYEDRKKLSDDEIVKNLYIKDKKWSYEKEVRTVVNKEKMDENYFICVDGKIYFKAKIRKIIFGCALIQEEDYFDALRAIIRYNKGKKEKDKIKVEKMMLKQDCFRLIYDKKFNMLKKLQKNKI